jgi:metal-dependent amidase/aminoacylase/carboxypeptidase family protein
MLDDTILSQLTTLRKALHAHPEVSGEEYKTQKKIIDFLSKETKADVEKVANTGVLATFLGTEDGPTTMIRGDIDALPIAEINEFEHRSTVAGVSHKCGHDGHTSILLCVKQSANCKRKSHASLSTSGGKRNGRKSGARGSIIRKCKIGFCFCLTQLTRF